MPAAHRSSRRFLRVAIAGVVGVVTALGAFLPGFLASAEDDGARAVLARSQGADAALDVALPLTAATNVDEAVRAAIADRFGPDAGSGPLGLTVSRTSLIPTVATSAGDAAVASIPDLRDAAMLVDGAWSSAGDEATIQADAAAELGVVVGDTLTVAGARLRITGLWRLSDPRAGRWFASPLLWSGNDGRTIGPIAVDDAAFGALASSAGASAVGHWTLVPDARTVTAAGLDGAVPAWRGMPDALAAHDVDDDPTLSGRLVPTALAVRAQTAAMAAAVPLAASITALVGVVVLIEIVRLDSVGRTRERLLLWSRGAGTGRLITDVTAEVVPAALIGGVCGAVASATALAVTCGIAALVAGLAAVTIAPIAVAGAAVAITAIRAAVDVRDLDAPARRIDPRVLATAGAVVVALLVGAAVLAGWQLVLYGSARGAGSDAALVDPLAVLAPALALIAAVVVAAAMLRLAGAPLERTAARSRAMTGPLIVRGLLRRRSFALTALMLCAVATGQLVLAAGYSATWENGSRVASAVREGTRLSVSTTFGTLSPSTVDEVAGLPGVAGVAPVSVSPVSVSAQSVDLIAIAASAVRALADPGVPEVESTVSAMTPDSPPGLLLPPGERARIGVSWDGARSSASVILTLADDWGRLVRTDAATIAIDGGSGDADVAIPAPFRPEATAWRLMAVDVTGLEPASEIAVGTVHITAVAVGDTYVALDVPWRAIDIGPFPLPLVTSDSGPSVSVDPGITAVRLAPAAVRQAPLVITQALAASTGLKRGDSVPILVDSQIGEVPLTVSAVVPALPGAGDALAALVDIRSLWLERLLTNEALPAPARLWLDAPDMTAAALAGAVPAQLVLSGTARSGDDALRAAASALWLGAVGTAALAVTAVAAVIGAQTRSRRAEGAALRGIGMSATSQARVRTGEIVASCVLGIVVGLFAGSLVVIALIPSIARGAIPGGAFGDVPPRVAAGPLVVSLVLFALAVAAVIAASDHGVRRDQVRLLGEGPR